MHDTGMILVVFLLGFGLNLLLGVYNLFLRGQIAGLRDAEKTASDLKKRVEQLETQIEADRTKGEVRERELQARLRATEEARHLVDVSLGDMRAKLSSTVTKEAGQGIRGDIRSLTERLDIGLKSLAEKIDSRLASVDRDVVALERRVDRVDEHLLHTRKAGS